MNTGTDLIAIQANNGERTSWIKGMFHKQMAEVSFARTSKAAQKGPTTLTLAQEFLDETLELTFQQRCYIMSQRKHGPEQSKYGSSNKAQPPMTIWMPPELVNLRASWRSMSLSPCPWPTGQCSCG